MSTAAAITYREVAVIAIMVTNASSAAPIASADSVIVGGPTRLAFWAETEETPPLAEKGRGSLLTGKQAWNAPLSSIDATLILGERNIKFIVVNHKTYCL